MPERIRWDGRPATLELLRASMPECIEGCDRDGVLRVRGFRKTSARKGVPDSRVVPIGWSVTRKANAHGPYAAVAPPEPANA